MKITLDGMYKVQCCDLSAGRDSKGKRKREVFPLLKDGHLPKGYEFVSLAPLNFDGVIALYVQRKAKP